MKAALMTILLACLSASALAGSALPDSFELVETAEIAVVNQPGQAESEIPPGYLARLELNKPEEVEATLKRVEEIYLSGELDTSLPPVTFIIHGPEAVIFLKENYGMYMALVDLASRLTEKKVVDIKVCANRLNRLNASDKPLQPFVGTVKFGPVEAKRLRKKEGYEYFPSGIQ